MAIKLNDWKCPACNHVFEFLSMGADDAPEQCPKCTHSMDVIDLPFEKVVGAGAPPVTIVKGNSDYAQRERARLQTRADEHWKREGRHEATDRIRAKRKKDGV